MSGPMLYVSVPTQITAMQWKGYDNTGRGINTEDFWDWCSEKFVERMGFTHLSGKSYVAAGIYVHANSAWLPLETGEWVAKDSHGFYPIKNDVFEKKYRLVPESDSP